MPTILYLCKNDILRRNLSFPRKRESTSRILRFPRGNNNEGNDSARYEEASSQLMYQMTPNLSVQAPKYPPQKASLIGMRTLPPSDSAANSASASSRVSGETLTAKLLP